MVGHLGVGRFPPVRANAAGSYSRKLHVSPCWLAPLNYTAALPVGNPESARSGLEVEQREREGLVGMLRLGVRF